MARPAGSDFSLRADPAGRNAEKDFIFKNTECLLIEVFKNKRLGGIDKSFVLFA